MTAAADPFARPAVVRDPPDPAPLLDGRLRDLLAGQTIVMTGVTGFIGEQLLWKILTELPDTRPAVLVRRKGSAAARDRVVSLVKKAIFAEVARGRRRRRGAGRQPDRGHRGRPAERAGAAARPRRAGALRRRRLVRPADRPGLHHQRRRHQGADGADARGLPRRGRRRPPRSRTTCTSPPPTPRAGGAARSRRRPQEHSVDYEAETAAGLAMREQVEAASRMPERLTALRQEAERQHRPRRLPDHGRRHRAPPRTEWVQAELVRRRHRARPLPGLDRRLHLHQGPRRAGRRRAGRRHPRLDRPARHRRVVLGAPRTRGGSRASRWPSR